MKKTNSITDVRAAIAQGFSTQQAKKDAGRGLEVELGLLNRAAKDAGLEWHEGASYPHEIGKKAEAAYDRVGMGNWAREIKAARLELKAAPVVKAAAKVDDTKVREAEVQDPLVFTDSKGDERGVCWCCGRSGFKLNKNGLMSNHGFKRPGWGFQTSGCVASRMTPGMALELAIKWTGEQVEKLTALLSDDAALLNLQVRTIRREAFSVDRNGHRAYRRREFARQLQGLRRTGVASDRFRRQLVGERDQLIAHLARARQAMALHQAAA